MMIVASFAMLIVGTAIMHVPLLQVPEAMNKVENANATRWLNTAVSFLALLVPAFILARILSRRPLNELGFSTRLNVRQIIIVIFMAVAAIVLSNALAELNQRIPMPEKFIVKAKAFEKQYDDTIMVMASMAGTKDFIFSLLAMAFFPALFEEVLFRGGLQQIFVKWTKTPWLGILITSILFSLLHLSYFGFIPRVGLGMVLGYIFYYSRNIWLNILLHFLNNALIVTQMYLLTRSNVSKEELTKSMDQTFPVWWGLIALALLVVLFIYFKKESDKIKPEPFIADEFQFDSESLLNHGI